MRNLWQTRRPCRLISALAACVLPLFVSSAAKAECIDNDIDWFLWDHSLSQHSRMIAINRTCGADHAADLWTDLLENRIRACDAAGAYSEAERQEMMLLIRLARDFAPNKKPAAHHCGPPGSPGLYTPKQAEEAFMEAKRFEMNLVEAASQDNLCPPVPQARRIERDCDDRTPEKHLPPR